MSLVGVRPSLLPEFYEDTILLNPGNLFTHLPKFHEVYDK